MVEFTYALARDQFPPLALRDPTFALPFTYVTCTHCYVHNLGLRLHLSYGSIGKSNTAPFCGREIILGDGTSSRPHVEHIRPCHGIE